MKHHKAAAATVTACLSLLLSGSDAPAQARGAAAQASPTQAPSAPRPLRLRYTISRHSVIGFRNGEPYWVVTAEPDEVGTGPRVPWALFKTLADPELRQWINQLPQGSEITVMFGLGGGNRMGHLTPSQAAFYAELNNFTKFCQGKKLEVGISGGILY